MGRRQRPTGTKLQARKLQVRTFLKRPRGVSIAELLIVSILFFSLMSLVTMFMVRGKRMSVRTDTLCRVQNEAIKLTRKLTEDLNRGTIWGGLTGQWQNGGLIFLSSKPLDSSTGPALEFDPKGRIVWKQWVAYYRDPSTNEVRRFSKPLPSEVSDPALAAGSWMLPDLPGLPPSEGHTVAVGIVEFYPTGRDLEDAMEFLVKGQAEVPLGNLKQAEKLVEVEISTMIRLGAGLKP